MAHKKAGGSTALGRDSQSKRLGIKIYGEQTVKSGDIIVRQRGSKYEAGRNVKVGGDDTIFSTIAGIVKFQKKAVKNFTGKSVQKTIVHVEPAK
ncbi:50S ribosomal protein L27 [bacterium]|nr:50S ribosomal protein L27 [bacterium]